MPPATTTDAEIFYRLNPERFTRPERRTVRHILITYDTPEERAATVTLLEDLAAQLRAGADFADLALRHSQCPTAVQDGLVGSVPRGQLFPELDAALFTMAAGEVSGVLETEVGLHILRCDAILPSDTIPFADVRDRIVAALNAQRRQPPPPLREKKMDKLKQSWLDGIAAGSVVPYLGPGVLADVRATTDGRAMPATSDALIIAMNDGKPMAPKLMYEFPRAAMNVELKRGRVAVTKFLNRTYGETTWTRSAAHDWIARLKPRYVIDINRDTQLQDSYAATPHTLVVGIARIGGTEYRFKMFAHDGATGYTEVTPETVDPALPVLFKPMGTPKPQPHYIASDADYVDFITELMGGFAVPPHVKAMRPGKQYLFIGMRFNRDSERMVMSDLIYGAGSPAGWALIPQPTDKERRFLGRMNIEIVEADLDCLIDCKETAAC